jgi:hypothetical protein
MALSAMLVEDLLVRFYPVKVETYFESKIRTGCSFFLKSVTPPTSNCPFLWYSPPADMPSQSSKLSPPPYTESSDNHQDCSFPTQKPSPFAHLSPCKMWEQHNLDRTLAGPSKPANSSGRRALTISGFGNSQTRAETDPTETLTDPMGQPEEEPQTADPVSEMKSTKFSTNTPKVPDASDIEAYPAETATKSQSLGKRTKDFKNKLNRRNQTGKVSKSSICLGLLFLIAPVFSIIVASLNLGISRLDAYKAAGWSAMIPVFVSCTLDHFFPQNPPGISLLKWNLLKVLFSIWVGWACGGAIGIAMTKQC